MDGVEDFVDAEWHGGGVGCPGWAGMIAEGCQIGSAGCSVSGLRADFVVNRSILGVVGGF